MIQTRLRSGREMPTISSRRKLLRGYREEAGEDIRINNDGERMPTLNWIGKEAVVDHHRRVPTRLLECDRALSVGDPEAENLLVEGDNLEALKALLPRYRGQVKCIYIDPPYNTGNEGWVYNDNVNDPRIRKWLGDVVGKEAEDLCRHDKWLCMMYPRLALLREFLREDGSIFISIDDNSVANLRMLMDELFGRERFIACNVWQKRYSRENREAIGDVHEYIIVYAMNPSRFKETRNLIPLTAEQAKVYKNINNHPRGRWRGIPMTAQGYRPNQMYEIETPAGVKHKPPEGRCWSMIEAEYRRLKEDGRIYYGKDNRAQPSVIRFLDEVDGFVPWTWWTHEEVGHTDEARKEIQTLFGTQTAFDTPKPTRLIKRVLQIATNAGDLVLDSFAGSGTTGQAVTSMNASEGGNRRCILIELNPSIARDVTRQRLDRVCSGYTIANGDIITGLGSGFRYCRLGRTLLDEQGNINGDVPFVDLARYVYLLETGVPVPARPRKDCPLLGSHRGRAIYLLYNGVLGDRRPAGGNVLTQAVLASLPPHPDGAGPRTIYGEACRLSDATLRRSDVTFRQVPYSLREV